MSEYFGQRFGIEPRFDTSRGEGVAERVKGIALEAVPLEKSLIPHIKRVRLGWLVRAGKQINLRRFALCLQIIA